MSTNINLEQIPSPCFVLEDKLLERNLQLLADVQTKAGVSIILALKGFAMWSVFPQVKQYLSGISASSLSEVLLCANEMKTKAHTYAPVYLPNEIDTILENSSQITFNSLSQLDLYKEKAKENGVSIGIRVNPECSVVETDLYNPCSPTSRLGILAEDLTSLPDCVDGLHVHALCESGADELELLLNTVELKFGHLFDQINWINLGGGHLLTRENYNFEKAIELLKSFKKKHNLEIILEPGSAVAWQTGFLVATVLDIIERRGTTIALTDISFTAHMPDTLEMPYRPEIRNAGKADEFPYKYRIGGLSCLAGDFKDDYSFVEPLQVGQKLIFEDMIHYTMVKTNMFNGVTHPHIGILKKSGEFNLVRSFNYEDYKTRLS